MKGRNTLTWVLHQRCLQASRTRELQSLRRRKRSGLDFIPVAKERYDLAVPFEFYDTDMIRALLSIIRENNEFRDMVAKLGGYDVSDMGKVIDV